MSQKLFRVGRSRTGLGLFAVTEIRKGRIITEYRGRRISNQLAESREKYGARYMFELNKKWTVDGSPRWNLARYANHACRPNAEADIVRGKILLRAIKRINPDDEITYDYGKEYFDLFFRQTSCLCAHCIEKKRSARKKASPRSRGKKPKKTSKKTR